MKMKIFVGFLGVIFLLVGGVAEAMSPDMLCRGIIAVMILIVAFGYFFGMIPVVNFTLGFRNGRQSIQDAMQVESESTWTAVQQNTEFFHKRVLDELFANYVSKSAQEAEDGLQPGNIEEIINSESLAIRSWQSIVIQIPGIMTALGLLGTFVGLVTGISNIGFSSVDAALGSVEVLLSGIRTAFYTSIFGVIFSILFNITSKIIWNTMLREFGFFIEQFHMYVVPPTEEQQRLQHVNEIKAVMACLERIPNPEAQNNDNADSSSPDAPAKEQEDEMMEAIRAGLDNNEFIFYLQARHNLNTNLITGSEALLRWKRPNLGIMPTSSFLSIVEKNGFIVRIDTYIWESVFQTIQRWIQEGLRPTPVSVNLSTQAIKAMDVAFFFTSMSHKYSVPPYHVDIEIAQSAYMECEQPVREAETQLRQAGFRVIIDNFDGNYAALNLLSLCHADAVKMDLRTKSIEDIEELYEQTQTMNLPIIVENIENSKQLGAIRKCGCSEGQGFYFSRPVSVQDFEQGMRPRRELGVTSDEVVEEQE